MSTLHILRKVKSTFNAAAPHRDAQPSTIDVPPKQLARSRLQKSQDRLRQIRSPSAYGSSDCPYQIQANHPLTDFRRRLARKASTFSLRAKRWKAEVQGREQEQDKEAREPYEAHEKESVFGGSNPGFEEQKLGLVSDRNQENVQEVETRVNQAVSSSTVSAVTTIYPAAPAEPIPDQPGVDVALSKRPFSASLDPVQAYILSQQQNHTRKEAAGGITCVDMASEQAAPPVPYTRLKEITENVSRGPPAYFHLPLWASCGVLYLLTDDECRPAQRRSKMSQPTRT